MMNTMRTSRNESREHVHFYPLVNSGALHGYGGDVGGDAVLVAIEKI